MANIKGIYLAVELNTKKIEQQVKSLVSSLDTQFRHLSNIQVAPQLNTDKLTSDLKRLSVTAETMQKEIAAMGDVKAFSKMLLDTKNLQSEMQALAGSVGVTETEMRKLLSDKIEANSAMALARSFMNLQKMIGRTGEQAIATAEQMYRAGKLPAQALDIIKSKLTTVESSTKSLFSQLKNIITTSNFAAAIQSSLATLGANISVAGLVELGKAAVDTTIKIDSLKSAFTAIYGDSIKAGTELDYVRSVTKELGLEYYSTAGAAKKFFAAAENSGLSKDAEEIFHAFSAASSALKLSGDETNGVFLAISQMMSKGKISAEELRQQLAERLPGAVQLLAKAMGVTTSQLDSMLQKGQVGLENLVLMAKEVENTYGQAGQEASQQLLGRINALKTSWEDLKASIFNSDNVANALSSIVSVVDFLKNHMEELKSIIDVVGWTLLGAFAPKAVLAVFTPIIKGIVSLYKNFKTFIILLGSIRGLKDFTTLISASISPLKLFAVGLAAAGAAYALFKNNIDPATKAVNDFIEAGRKINESTDNMESNLEKVSKMGSAVATSFMENTRNSLQVKMDDTRAELLNAFTGMADKLRKEIKALNDDPDASVSLTISNEKALKFIEDMKNQIGDARVPFEELLKKFEDGKLSLDDFRLIAGGTFRDFCAKADQTIIKTVDMQSQFDTVTNRLNETKNAAIDAGNALREAFSVNITKDINSKLAVLDVEINGLKNKAASSVIDAEKSLVTDFKIKGIDFEGNAYERTIPQEDLSKLSSNLKKGTFIDAASSYIEEKTGAKPDFDTMKQLALIDKTYKLSSLKESQKSAKSSQTAAEKAAKAQEKLTKKQDAAKAKMEEYETELAQLTEQNTYDTDSFNYAWEGTNKTLIEAKNKISEFAKKYGDVVGADKMKEVADTLTQSATKKQQAEQEKLLREWLSKSDSALDEYYEAHGMVNQRILDDAKKTYDNQVDALNQMYEKGLIAYEDYADRLKALQEEYNKTTDKEKGVKEGSMFGSGTEGAMKAFTSFKENALDLEKISNSLTTSMLDGFTDAFTNVITGSASAKEAFGDFAKSLLSDLTKIYMRLILVYTIQKAMGWLAGGGKSFDYSGYGNEFSYSGSAWNAKGGVYGNGSLSSFSNGVYSTPTYFNTNGSAKRYANGGVFGEAGPEAIMPLTRMANGRLGVASSGSSSSDVKVNVYNYGNDKATASSSKSSTGGKTIDIVIGDMVASQMSTPGTRLNRVVSAQTNSSNPVTRR